MQRAYYSATISNFRKTSTEEILGALSINSEHALIETQRSAWIAQISILREGLAHHEGAVYFEYSIPRMGRRIDVALVIGPVIFVLEFKVGATIYSSSAFDQVYDYALDLKNFHDASHEHYIAPVLIATDAEDSFAAISLARHDDKVFAPILTNRTHVSDVIRAVLDSVAQGKIDIALWEAGRYCPTPTIVEAALALYNNHSVADITRNDAGAINLKVTSESLSGIISSSRKHSQKAICLVTGVPGAGKTLVGLDVATKHSNATDDLYSVYLSGNGPLVKILCEALARDKVSQGKDRGIPVAIGRARSSVKAFIQNVHHFRDECLKDVNAAPIEHVAIFDEAQRAWNKEQTSAFMQRKKNTPNFAMSEPEFLISCMDRHPDWAVIVCLIGGGQEINTGEAGIGEWIRSIARAYPDWHLYMSSRLTDSEYRAGAALDELRSTIRASYVDELHLGVSMRAFRAEDVSLFIKQLLDLEVEPARRTYAKIREKYPIVITRNLARAKAWLREQARGSERYGIVVSSQAERLKPHAIDVRSPVDPVHWFLDGKDDVRSSFYLEDVATEFHIQGLELDWACVAWDADLRLGRDRKWTHHSFRGNGWNNINKQERQQYLKNAYRVLLTRARQGMVVVVPHGDTDDHTRRPEYYDGTYEYFREIGFVEI
ncbi:MAG TPA: DUF2075 domain-containing protein [Gallionellaceae bacterium]|nr:DUF2075 domain-containing protein [Gallionellaceae bacterium]